MAALNPIINELQQAALIIMAPPSCVTPDQRKSAEEVYINFQKTKAPYNLCREIFETSTVDLVVFQTAGVLKNALIREWSELDDNDIQSLRQYLLHYIMTKEIPSFVREKILQIIAIMVKRQSCDDFGVDRTAILTEIENVVTTGTLPRKIIACNLLAAIMQEYSTSCKSSDVGLSWDIHFKAKKLFEATDLPRIFKFCVRALTEVFQGDPPYPQDVYSLTKHFLSLSETVLTWGCVSPLLPKLLIGMFEAMHEADQAPALRVTPAWKDILLDPELLALFFTSYWKVRSEEQLAHHAMNCLVQFATLSGGIIETDHIKMTYVTNYIESFLKLIDSIDLIDRECLGLSNIVRKLVMYFPPRILVQLPENVVQTFLEHVAKLTCRFAEGAAHEESFCNDDRFYMEAFDNILEAWCTILTENSFPRELISKLSIEILNTYLRHHLSPPEGTRAVMDESEDMEESDLQRFKDQLKTIGLFGMQVPGYTIPLLSRLLEQKTQYLQNELERIHNRTSNTNTFDTLDNLFEDLHSLISIAGNVICMDSEGETALIPAEIMKFCISQSEKGKVNTELSLKLLASPSQPAESIPNIDEFVDPLIRLISAVFRLSEVEKSAAEARLQYSLSPKVGSSIIWFLSRFSVTYLIPNETNYFEICPLLLTAFGRDSEGAVWTTNFLLSKIHSNIVHFLSEITLLTDSVQLLVTLVENVGEKGCVVAKSEGLWNIVLLQSNLEPGTIPQTAKRGLYRAFTLCAASLDAEQQSGEFLQQIINPVTLRFKQNVSQDNFNRIYHLENVKTQLIDILDSIVGICQGSHIRTCKMIFQMLTPVLSELAALLNIYHNYQLIVQLILEVFCESARKMLCYLNSTESRKMYEFCYTTVQAYAQCNTNRLSIEATAEENSFQDILLVLELLTNISTKDCIDLSDQQTPTTPDDQPVITASDVCLYGLNFIMPLMTIELLKYPQLCTQYFRMVTFICEFYPDKVCDLPTDLLSKLLQSIQLGLTNFGSDVVTWSLEAIQLLATNIYRHSLQSSQMYLALMPFLQLLIDLILRHMLPNDVSTHSSMSLYSLICIYPEQYANIVRELLSRQEDPVIAEKLATAFNDLMNGVKLNCERQGRMKFRDKFDKFIVKVHGVLIMK